MTRRKFAHYRGDVAASPLHSAGGVQLREEAKEHASSLPSAAPEHKMRRARGFRRALGTPVVAYNIREIRKTIEVHVGRMCSTVMHAEAIIYCRSLRTGVARGLYVHLRIAYD
jgi:hypothetical protein